MKNTKHLTADVSQIQPTYFEWHAYLGAPQELLANKSRLILAELGMTVEKTMNQEWRYQ